MKYPVMNLGPRMGGMLEDYQNEINRLKDKLNKPNPGAYGYLPPSSQFPGPPPPPPPSAPSEPSGTATYFGPRPGPIVATGEPKPSNPNEITIIRKPAPPPPPPSGPSNPFSPRPSVVTGIPPAPYSEYNPPVPAPGSYGLPPLEPPSGGCQSGYTWTPSGCKKDVPTTPDRPPMYPPPPALTTPPSLTTTQTPATTGMVPTGGVNSTPPGATGGGAPVASTDCSGPGQFWDGRQCRGSVGSLPTIPGGGSSGVTAASEINAGAGAGGLTSVMGFMGKVRMAGVRPASPFLPQVRLR